MPKQTTMFMQFIASVNNNTSYTFNSKNKASIMTRIDDVFSVTPTHILQRLDEATFDKKITLPKNIKNTMAISIFKAFLQFSKEEQMTIQKFLYCPCFDKIVEYMTPEQKVETCKHINKYIETIQNSIDAAIESHNPKQQETKSTKTTKETEPQTTLPTEETTENTQETPENTRNVQSLIQTLNKHANIKTPTEDNTKTISTIIKQLQQQTTNQQKHHEEIILLQSLNMALNIGDLDNIGANPTQIKTTLKKIFNKKNEQTTNTKTKKLEASNAKEQKRIQKEQEALEKAIAKIKALPTKEKREEAQETIQSIQQKKLQRRIHCKNKIETKKMRMEAEAKKKEEEEKLKEAAGAKTKYQIISLIYDTPYNKKLKEQYIKDNPEITKHELYPILEIIHNYIYAETEQSTTEQESTQKTTEQEKRQIFILSILHDKIQTGYKHLLEFNRRINDIRLLAHKAPAHKFQHLHRITHETYSDAWQSGHGSIFMQQVVKMHELYGDNPNILSAYIQGMLNLMQKIYNKENSKRTHIAKITLLEASKFALAGVYIDHYPKEAQLEFLQAANISKPQTEEEAKKLIKDFLTTIKPTAETTPFELMKQTIQTRYNTLIYNNLKSSLQDIFAYIKDTGQCNIIAAHKALIIKEITAEHKNTAIEPLYKYNAKFISKKENIPQIVLLIALFMANAKILEKNKSLHDTEEQIPSYLGLAKISQTQHIIKKIILSLLQTPNISYIKIIEAFNSIWQANIEAVNQCKNNNPEQNPAHTVNSALQTKTKTADKGEHKYPKQKLTQIIHNKTHNSYDKETSKSYTQEIQKIAQEQETYFTDNEATISTEQTANIETETITEKIKHSQTPINLQTATTHTPSSEQEQPRAQQLITTTQKRKRKSKHLLDAEHKTPRKKQYENTSPQSPTTLITEITSVQQNKAAYSQRQ